MSGRECARRAAPKEWLLLWLMLLAVHPSARAQELPPVAKEIASDSITMATSNFAIPEPGALAMLPREWDLEDVLEFPPVGHQGAVGSCVSWAAVYCVQSMIRKTRGHLDYYKSDGQPDSASVLSPMYVFNHVQLGTGTCDKRVSYVKDNFRFLQNTGTCRLDQFHPKGGIHCEVMPPYDMTSEAAHNKVKHYGWLFENVDYIPGEKLSRIKKAVTSGYPVILIAYIDSLFHATGGQWDGDKIVWRKKHGRYIGQHAVVCIGYSDGLQAVKVYNSYGADWSNEGYGYISYGMLEDAAIEGWLLEADRDMLEIPGHLIAGRKLSNVGILKGSEHAFIAEGEQETLINVRSAIAVNNIVLAPVHIDSSRKEAVFQVYELEDGKALKGEVIAVKEGDNISIINKYSNNVPVNYNIELKDIKNRRNKPDDAKIKMTWDAIAE